MIDVHAVTFLVIFAGLFGAIVWDLITWYYGLPTSSSHALIGGYAGGAVAHAGMGVIIPGGWTKTLIFIVLAPTIGLVLGLILMTAIYWLFRDMAPSRVDRCSGVCSWYRQRSTAWGTVPTTRRRRWASSPACCSRPAISTSSRFRCGSCSRRTRQSRWGRSRAAGGSSTRWARRSRGCSRSEDLRPRRPARCRCSRRQRSGVPVSTTHTITGAIVGVGATRPSIGRALGHRGPDRLGVDPDDSSVGADLGQHLLGAVPPGLAAVGPTSVGP